MIRVLKSKLKDALKDGMNAVLAQIDGAIFWMEEGVEFGDRWAAFCNGNEVRRARAFMTTFRAFAIGGRGIGRFCGSDGHASGSDGGCVRARHLGRVCQRLHDAAGPSHRLHARRRVFRQPSTPLQADE